MNILAIGDVVGEAGLETLSAILHQVKRKFAADFTIVNGENAASVGLTPKQAQTMLQSGADVITLGNHTFRKRQIIPFLEDCPSILRPANFAPQSPGRGAGIFAGPQGMRILVFNLVGRCEMQFGPDNPFLCADRILRDWEGQYDIALCDFHAGATSEKIAMGYYLDGRVSCVWGTHTHVQTADERVNPKGTGYITDIGMTGPIMSVLGVCVEQSIALFRGDMTTPFQTAPGDCALGGALFTLNADGTCQSVSRVWEEYKRA